MEALAAMGLMGAAEAGVGAGAAGALGAGGAATGGLMAMPSMAAGVGSMLGPAGALSAEGLVAPSVGGLMSASSIPAASSLGASPLLQNVGLGMGILNQGKALLAPPSPPSFIPSNAPGPAMPFSSPVKVVNTALSPIGGQQDILALLTQLLQQRGVR